MRMVLFGLAAAFLTAVSLLAADEPVVEPWRTKLYTDWKALPVPPITPYSGPFGADARAFTSKIDLKSKDKAAVANWKALYDYPHTGKNGLYDPAKDPREINHDFETAVLEDWRRMGYNCSYKGFYFTFQVGSYLKEHGLLGAIDQTLFGQNGPPPVQFDGHAGKKQREGCGSYFHPDNYEAGVAAITGMGHLYGKHLFTVGDHRVTCSWDEIGLRSESQMDFHPNAVLEFRKFLKDVWFQDAAPGEDTNGDGRTYNAFTGESRATWDDVQPLPLSLDWATPFRRPDGSVEFSRVSEVDSKLFEETGRYKLLVDFHRYFPFEFFRRVSDDASDRMNALGTPGRITCYPFVQHFIIWPGINHRNGLSFYWHHKLNPIVSVEHCWPESPAMNLSYAVTDRLAPQMQNLVMGWVWFYFGREGADMYNGPHDIDRALARMIGHTVDGSHHWLYSPIYRGRDQKQRLQVAFWQNFLASHYATYLSRSQPIRPQVALLLPSYTGYFYRLYQYPKLDFAYTAAALENLQLAYHVITEEELELNPQTLDGYKALYVVGSEWTTPTIRERIEKFLAGGGVVYANVDSLSLDIPTGQRTDFLERTFGVKLEHKYKNGFFPSTQTFEEADWAVHLLKSGSPMIVQNHSVHQPDDPRAWSRLFARTSEKFLLDDAGKPRLDDSGRPIRDPGYQMIRDAGGRPVRDESLWKLLDQAMASMPTEARGLPQSPLDMRKPPQVRYGKSGPVAENWGEIDTATVVRGQPIAWWDDKVVGVETENTVWMGTREGLNIHAVSGRLEMHRTTEPCNPFPTLQTLTDNFTLRRPYVDAIGRAAVKARIQRPVTVQSNGQLPLNIEVLPRVDSEGTLMVVLINHDESDAEYDISIRPELRAAGSEVVDLLTLKTIAANANEPIRQRIEPWGVSVLLIGRPDRTAPIKAAQEKLLAKDLSVPQYFLDRPDLNTPEHNTPIPPVGQ